MRVIPVIRYCEPEDFSSILELAKHSVSKVLPEEEYEEDKIDTLFNLSLKNEDYTCISLVISGKVVGYVFGSITEHYFHSKKIAYCMSIYVDEEYRQYGLEMLKAFEAWGKYKGAKTLSISTFTGLSPKSLGTVYKRLKYREKEIVYWKEL